MGNQANNNKSKQSHTTTLGHSVGEPPLPDKGKGWIRSRWLSISQLLSLSKKKQNSDQMESYQPPLDPILPKPEAAATTTTTASFAPLGVAELNKSYQVDWSSEGILGQGHYAKVFRGSSNSTTESVAVKRVAKKLTQLETLKLEVEALRVLSGHPNIVTLYDVYLDDDYMYLVLELLDGGELFDRIVGSGAYSERDAVRHMRSIGSALQHMHVKGIVHRDLKPENLVLADKSWNSEIKISDFGLSKMLKEEEEVMMTICGTKAYSAPEVGFGFREAGVPRDDKGYSSKVDMWSLGVILYVIVAAYHPFDPTGCDSDGVIWSRIVAGQWEFEDTVWLSISPHLKDLLRQLIEVDPDKRLSAEEFLQHPWFHDVETPMNPLPSLSRNRSSRYWKLQLDDSKPKTLNDFQIQQETSQAIDDRNLV